MTNKNQAEKDERAIVRDATPFVQHIASWKAQQVESNLRDKPEMIALAKNNCVDDLYTKVIDVLGPMERLTFDDHQIFANLLQKRARKQP